MSDEKQKVIDVTPEAVQENKQDGGELGCENPTGQDPAPEAAPEGAQTPVDLQYGFVCGVRQDGGVMLEMIGEKKGLIEMLGLCKYAEYHLNYTLDAASGQGAPIISQQIHQLAEMMKVLLNVIAQGRKPQDSESRIVTP